MMILYDIFYLFISYIILVKYCQGAISYISLMLTLIYYSLRRYCKIRDASEIGMYPREWSFCESGLYAATLTEFKREPLQERLLTWIPFINFTEKRILQIYVYHTATKSIYDYIFVDVYETEVHGYYWQGNDLVVVHQNYSKNEVELRLYELDHDYHYVKFLRNMSFPCLLQRKPYKRCNNAPFLEEIIINGQAYTPVVFYEKFTHIILVPRFIKSTYQPKEYYCDYTKSIGIAQEEIDLGNRPVYYSRSAVINGSQLYFAKIIRYSEQQTYKYKFNNYICIDLSKMKDVYGQEKPVDIDTVISMQDNEAVIHKIIEKLDKTEKDENFQTFGKHRVTTTFKNHQFTYVKEMNPNNTADDQLVVYHLNVDTQTVSILRLKDKYGLTVCLHPLGFLVCFSPHRMILGKPLVNTLKLSVIPTLKGILAAKTFFSEEFDEKAAQDVKFVLY